jgi:DNA-binding transcriptional LysR family regulator
MFKKTLPNALPNLERLKPFIEIYETRSLAAAAKKLRITPGGVSQHLKSLEHELGCQLFIRTKKEAIPTRSGTRIYDLVRKFFDEFGEISHAVKGAKLTPSGRLRIAAPMEFSVHFLVPFIAKFQEQYPEVSVDVIVSNIPYIALDKLVKNEVDLAYVDAADTFLRQYPVLGRTVMLEEQVLVAAQSVIKDKATNYDSLCELDFVSHVQEATDIKFWLKYHFDRIPGSLNVRLSMDSVRAIIAAVKHGAGLALVPLYLIEKEIKSGELILIQGKKAKHYANRISLAQIPEKKKSLAERTFESSFKEMYGSAELRR